jgi:hypothetical protein
VPKELRLKQLDSCSETSSIMEGGDRLVQHKLGNDAGAQFLIQFIDAHDMEHSAIWLSGEQRLGQ